MLYEVITANNGYIINPGSESAGKVLSTDGSSNFSWATPALSDFTLDADNKVITNVATPLTNLDAANKSYVDTEIGAISYNDLNDLPVLITGVQGGNGMTGSITGGVGTLNVVADNGLTTSANRVQLGGALTANTTITAGANNFNLNLNNTGNFNILDGATTRLLVRNDGNVAIKHTNPTQALDVNGQVRIRGGSPGVGKLLTSDANGVATWADPVPFAGALTEATTITAGAYDYTVDLNSSSGGDFKVTNSTIPSTQFIVTEKGDIGIGTNNPGSAGTRNVEIYSGEGDGWLTFDSKDASNFQVGMNSGGGAEIRNINDAPITFKTNNIERLKITSNSNSGAVRVV